MAAAAPATPSPTRYRAKLFMSEGDSYFTLVACPRCRVDFRLLWPVTVLNYPKNSNLHLKCPRCQTRLRLTSSPLAKCATSPAAAKTTPLPPSNPSNQEQNHDRRDLTARHLSGKPTNQALTTATQDEPLRILDDFARRDTKRNHAAQKPPNVTW